MPRRVMQGKVVSDKGAKTVVVQVERIFLHPVLKKTVRRSKRFHAHDEADAYKEGDLVEIRECPPKSRLKRWEVVGAIGASGERLAAAALEGQTP